MPLTIDYGRPKIILGAMEHGRRLNKEDSIKVTKHFLSQNYKEIDTAYVYVGGKSEEVLGQMQDNILVPNDALVSTKIHPKAKSFEIYGLSPKGMLQQFNMSLKRLNIDCVDILYLHFPDPNNSLLETVKTINNLYSANKIKRFGLSNFSSWQVTEIYYLCKTNDYILPTVYQGMYNAITRDIERELIFCLKRFNIKFYAYNILAGGLLSGKHRFDDNQNKSIKTGRFQGNAGEGYRNRYWQNSKFEAISLIKNEINKYNQKYNDNINIIEASLRWMMHHSLLDSEDGIILGASSYKHYIDNLKYLQCDQPLHNDIVKAFNDAWYISKRDCVPYIGYHKQVWNEMRCKL